MIQSGIAVVAFAALLGLQWGLSSHKGKRHTDTLITALVDFHKSQCYFSSTIQITALFLFNQSQRSSAEISESGSGKATSFRDIFDTSVLVALATTGFLPITLTLTCVARYGRLSWYLLILSSITTILATATLASSYAFNHGNSDYFDSTSDSSSTGQFYYPLSNDLKSDYWIDSSSVLALCGSSKLKTNDIGTAANASSWIWVVWGNCIAWLLYCLSKKLCEDEWWLQKIRPIYNRYTWMRSLRRVRTYQQLWVVASVSIWALCFGAQFYLFSLYFRHSVISPKWSFGQIIAITVWVPSLFEYVYIEHSKPFHLLCCLLIAPYVTLKMINNWNSWNRGSF